MKKYKNRYGDIFTFTELENGNILWGGNFEHCRFGWPNNYSDAYKEYLNDGGELPLEEFKKYVHFDEKLEYLQSLVVSNTDVIDMVDPPGGPFISSSMDMKQFGFPGKVVKEFKSLNDVWEIIVSKTDNK